MKAVILARGLGKRMRRADGDANVEELKALRIVGDDLSGGVRYDNEWLLFFSHVTPRSRLR